MKSKHCLIVDDSKSARFTIKKLLEKLGHTVDLVDSGDAALEYLEASHPEVIFMDHLMPGKDGFATAQHIRKNDTLNHIPIIMCTSKEGAAYEHEALTIGATGILPKPPSLEQVEEIFNDLDNLQPAQAQSNTTNNPIASNLETTTGITRTSIERMVNQISTGVAKEVARQVIQEKWVELNSQLRLEANQMTQQYISSSIPSLQENLTREILQTCDKTVTQQNKKIMQELINQRVESEIKILEKKNQQNLDNFTKEIQRGIPDPDALHDALIEEAKNAAEFTAAHKSVEAARQVSKEITRKEISTLMKSNYLPQIEEHIHGHLDPLDARFKQLQMIGTAGVAVGLLAFLLAIIL